MGRIEVKMLIDLSHPIENGMPIYPGDTETKLIQTNIFQKDGFSNHQITINMHAGTHIDGPMHLTDSQVYIRDVPLDVFIGDACVIDVSTEPLITYKEEYEAYIRENQIVVLYTGFSKYYGLAQYYIEHPVLTKEFAELLARKKVKMIGLDAPSPDQAPHEIHKYLFENKIMIAENLTNVEKLLSIAQFEIIALPLKIRADSSVARIVARAK